MKVIGAGRRADSWVRFGCLCLSAVPRLAGIHHGREYDCGFDRWRFVPGRNCLGCDATLPVCEGSMADYSNVFAFCVEHWAYGFFFSLLVHYSFFILGQIKVWVRGW